MTAKIVSLTVTILSLLTAPQRRVLAAAIGRYLQGCINAGRKPAMTPERGKAIADRLIQVDTTDEPTEQDLAVLRLLPGLPWTMPKIRLDLPVMRRALNVIGLAFGGPSEVREIKLKTDAQLIRNTEASIFRILNPDEVTGKIALALLSRGWIRTPEGWSLTNHAGQMVVRAMILEQAQKHQENQDAADAMIGYEKPIGFVVPGGRSWFCPIHGLDGKGPDVPKDRGRDRPCACPGDTECAECGRMFFSGARRTTLSICKKCWEGSRAGAPKGQASEGAGYQPTTFRKMPLVPELETIKDALEGSVRTLDGVKEALEGAALTIDALLVQDEDRDVAVLRDMIERRGADFVLDLLRPGGDLDPDQEEHDQDHGGTPHD